MMTRFNKKIFPAIWFGFLAVFLMAGVFTGAPVNNPLILLMPVVIGSIGFLVMKAFVWDLVDEVYDVGDYLVVRNRGEEDHIPLSNIMNVRASLFTNPPRITLKLAIPSKFGDEIVFSPVIPFTLNPFARNAVAEDLIIRVDRARSKRR